MQIAKVLTTATLAVNETIVNSQCNVVRKNILTDHCTDCKTAPDCTKKVSASVQ